MRRCVLAACAILALGGPAVAQPAPPFTPPDAELWGLMVRALHELPVSLGAHQGIDQILANIQREAMMRAARAKVGAVDKAAPIPAPQAELPAAQSPQMSPETPAR